MRERFVLMLGNEEGALTIPNILDPSSERQRLQSMPDSVDFDAIVAGINQYGVLEGCAVGERSPPTLGVDVAGGSISVGGVEVQVAPTNVALTAAHATEPRFDLIVASSTGVVSAVEGTHAPATPAPGPIFPDIPFESVVLASVIVEAASTSILLEDITDKRVFVGLAADQVARKPPGSEAIRYVSPIHGDDDNDGLSKGSAKATSQAAVDALPAEGGRLVLLKGDNTPFTARSGLHVEGKSKRSRIVPAAGQNAITNADKVAGISNFQLRNMTVDCTASYVTHRGVELLVNDLGAGGSVDFCLIENVHIIAAGGTTASTSIDSIIMGALARTSGTNLCRANHVKNCYVFGSNGAAGRLKNCKDSTLGGEVDRCKYGWYIQTNCRNCGIEHFFTKTTYNIGVLIETACQDCWFSDGTADGSVTTYGVNVEQTCAYISCVRVKSINNRDANFRMTEIEGWLLMDSCESRGSPNGTGVFIGAAENVVGSGIISVDNWRHGMNLVGVVGFSFDPSCRFTGNSRAGAGLYHGVSMEDSTEGKITRDGRFFGVSSRDMGGPRIVGAAFTASSGGVTPITVTRPADAKEGDVLVVSLDVRGGTGATITPPAGWTLERRSDNGTTLAKATYWKVVGVIPGEPDDYAFAFDVNRYASAGIVAIRGADTTAPVDVSAESVNATSTTPTMPGLTTTGSDRLVLHSAGIAIGDVSDAFDNYAPVTGLQERWDRRAGGGTTGQRTSSFGADLYKQDAGAVTEKVVQYRGATALSIGHTIAIKTAAGAGRFQGYGFYEAGRTDFIEYVTVRGDGNLSGVIRRVGPNSTVRGCTGVDDAFVGAVVTRRRPVDSASVVSDTTLANDDYMRFPIGPGEVWFVEVFAQINAANNVMDAKFQLSVPAGASGLWGRLSGTSGEANWSTYSTAATPAALVALSTVLTAATITGTTAAVFAATVENGPAAGEVIVQSAQNTSDAGALKRLKNSFVRATRIA